MTANSTPNLFIVGAPKCGTSAICAFLAQHPKIFISAVKEPFHFVENPVLNAREYSKLFENSHSYRRRGEGSTGYLYGADTPQRLYSLGEDVKIVICLRQPEKMAYSLWQFMKLSGNEIADFWDALEEEEVRSRDAEYLASRAGRSENYLYRERAMYSRYVNNYLDVFGADRIKFVIFEEFQKNPAQVMSDLFDFLDVDSSFTPTFKRVNEGGVVRSRMLQKLRQRKYPLLRSLVPSTLRWKIRQLILNANKKAAPNGVIDPVRMQNLARGFDDDITELSSLLNRDMKAIWRSQ